MSARRSWRLAVACTILAWCAAMLALRRTDAITDDWHGWRQADTQAIARNLAYEDFDVLHPRIDWRGDGPGIVETEAQLYPALIAVALAAGGESVWPGQLLSLAAVALAAALLCAALARRFGGTAAYAALLAMLSVQGTVVISTSIQPDALALLAFTLGWITFLDWLDAPSRARLAAWIATTAIAGLVKPTTLELGIAQLVFVAIARREALRDRRLWIGWGLVVIVVGAHLLHARSLYLAHGNTFGVLSGGDSKLPAASALAAVEPWLALARHLVVWGTGVLAVPAAIFLAWRRRLGREELALAAGALALSVLALRYTSHRYGTHYHLPHVVVGAWLVARAVGLLRPAHARLALAAVALVAVALTARGVRFVRAQPAEPETALGRALATLAAPGDLVVVRARAERYNLDWQTPNNFQDPRVFYLSRTRGWVLANDDVGPGAVDQLAEHARRGARFYVHVAQRPIDPPLAAWLDAHATRVVDGPAGAIYRLSRTK